MSALLPKGPDGRALKIRFGDLIEKAGGLEAAAQFCRPGKSMLHRYQSTSPADADCFAPADVIRDLERLVGEPVVTHLLAAEADHVLIAKPRLASIGSGDVYAAIAACSKESGEAQSSALTAVASGRFSQETLIAALREVDEAVEAKLRLRALLAQALEDSG